MSEINVEIKIMWTVSVIGWIALTVFCGMLFTLKGSSAGELTMLSISALVLVAGLVASRFYWRLLFPNISHQAGAAYFTPYRIGSALVLGVLILVAIVGLVANFQT